jgi:hypothetical protein
MTTSMEIDLVQPLIQQAQTPKQKDTSPLRAHALVQWLLTHHFPSKIRKSSLPVSVTSPHRGKIFIQLTDGSTEGTATCSDLDGPKWEKNVFQALRKITVEDLGNMNATELQSTIPLNDSEGRGMADLYSLEKKLSVKVVFDRGGHVLLVGDEKKLEKKVFVIRNMLSHYHWRLSGTDVSLAKATSSR